jgi:hypothetical protein
MNSVTMNAYHPAPGFEWDHAMISVKEGGDVRAAKSELQKFILDQCPGHGWDLAKLGGAWMVETKCNVPPGDGPRMACLMGTTDEGTEDGTIVDCTFAFIPGDE